jgi:hypothetical protein
MDHSYWIGRMHAAVTMARRAATAESRLVHYELAGRYSIRAAHCRPQEIAGTDVQDWTVGKVFA